MKFESVGYTAYFDNASLFWIMLTDLPADIKNSARSIDGKDYNEACFGMRVFHDMTDGQFKVSTEKDQETGEIRNLFYIDNDGNMSWYTAEIPEDVIKTAYDECRLILDGKHIPNGYEIRHSTLYEGGYGIFLAEKENAPKPFTTGRFETDSIGRNRYFRQRYFDSADRANADFARRNELFGQTHLVKEHVSNCRSKKAISPHQKRQRR